MSPKLSVMVPVIRRRMYELDIRTVKDLENKAGVTRDSIRHLLAGRTQTIRANKLEAVARALQISVDELVGDNGNPNRPMVTDDLPGDFVLVPRYNLTVAGDGSNFPEGQKILDYVPFAKDWIKPIVSGSMDDLATIEFDGESMFPAIRPGDFLLIDLADKKPVDGGIFALIWNGTVVVKRLFPAPGGIEVRSDNQSGQPQTISHDKSENLRIVGRVSARIGRLN